MIDHVMKLSVSPLYSSVKIISMGRCHGDSDSDSNWKLFIGIMNVKIMIWKIHLVPFIKAYQRVHYMSLHWHRCRLLGRCIHPQGSHANRCTRMHMYTEEQADDADHILACNTDAFWSHFTSAGNISSVAAKVCMSNFGKWNCAKLSWC